MKIGFALFCLAGMAVGGLLAQEEPVAAAVTPRALALDLAGAFSNDDFKIRDGHWSGELEPGKPQMLEVNLFAGNSYWFCAAASSPARGLKLTVFDAEGKVVDTSLYEDGAAVAAGLTAQGSGAYYIRLELTAGERAEFGFVYCYK